VACCTIRRSPGACTERGGTAAVSASRESPKPRRSVSACTVLWTFPRFQIFFRSAVGGSQVLYRRVPIICRLYESPSKRLDAASRVFCSGFPTFTPSRFDISTPSTENTPHCYLSSRLALQLGGANCSTVLPLYYLHFSAFLSVYPTVAEK
jgi:hypothetical protein